MRFLYLICPFKCKGISWKLCRPSKGNAICDVIIDGYQSVRRNRIVLDFFCKPGNGFFHSLPCHHFVLYHIESLLRKPYKLLFSGIFKIHAVRTHQGECKKLYMASGSDLIVQLTHRPTAQISRIFVFCIHICNLFIDLLKIFIRNNRLSAKDQLALIWYRKRNIFKNSGIVCDNFPDLTVSACNCLKKRTFTVCQYDGQSIHFPGEQHFMGTDKIFQHFDFFCLVKRKHRLLVSLFRKLFEHFITDLSDRTSCQDDPGLFFQFLELVIQPVILKIAHDLTAFLIIGFPCFCQKLCQLLHSLAFFLHVPLLLFPAFLFPARNCR